MGFLEPGWVGKYKPCLVAYAVGCEASEVAMHLRANTGCCCCDDALLLRLMVLDRFD